MCTLACFDVLFGPPVFQQFWFPWLLLDRNSQVRYSDWLGRARSEILANPGAGGGTCRNVGRKKGTRFANLAG